MADVQQLFTEAVSLHQRGALPEAEVRYRQVAALLPDNHNVLANLAIVLRDQGKLDQAEQYGRRVVTIAPENPASYLNLGAILESRGKLEEAADAYQRAHRLAPDHPQILNNLGKLLHQQGQSTAGRSLLEQALQIAPDYPAALNNLGVICSDHGDLFQAEQLLEKSATLDPDNINTLYNLAGIYNTRSKHSKALELLERVLHLAPSHQAAAHMRAALCGTTPPCAPSSYVEEVFDKYAGRFDHHLQEALEYTAPQALAAMVRAHCSAMLPLATILDLGCGTGLSGAAFREMAIQLSGIDISGNMLAQARQKKLYDYLTKAELLAFLDQNSATYSAFIAADVLVYLGDPEPLFPLLAKCSVERAIFACSIERCTENVDFTLRPSGRFAHNPSSLLRCARQHGFTILDHQDHNIRKEDGKWLPGDLFLFIRSAESAQNKTVHESPQTP
jgi:predicted TPR repeat methyltransferase